MPPSIFDGDARSVHEIAADAGPPGRPWTRQVLTRFVGGAVVLGAIGLSIQFAGDHGASQSDLPATRSTTASDVRFRVSTALSSIRTLRGEISIECAAGTFGCSAPAGERTTQRWSFVADAAGDERVTGIDHQVDLSYSTTQREERSVLDGAFPSTKTIANMAPGPPYAEYRTSSPLRDDVALLVRAFLATAEEVPVTEAVEGGRPAWRLAIAVAPTRGNGPGTTADQLEVVVDRQSGLPLRITETFAGNLIRDIRLSKLVVDGPVDPASFTFALPAGLTHYPRDGGFAAVALSGVEEVVGYRPVLPAPMSLPAGYTRAEVSVAYELGALARRSPNPPSRSVVAVAYRRGFDRIVVTTRLAGPAGACPSADKACWTDMVPRGEGVYEPYERYTVGAGALAGAHAELAMSPRGVPHVWTIDDRLVVTVAGDASAQELRHMAESFAEAS